MPLTAEQKKLVEDNYRLIYKFAGVNNLDITDDNVYDALIDGLCKTAMNHDINKATFSTLAFINMRNALWTNYRDNNVKKRCNQNEVLSLDYCYDSDGSSDEDSNLHEVVVDSDLTPDEKCFFKNIFTNSKLTSREKRIVMSLYRGYTNEQIGAALGITKQRVGQIIKDSIRKKISVYAF